MANEIQPQRLGSIVEASIVAYNAKDFDRYRGFLASEFYFCHYNRGFDHTDPDEFIATLKLFADQLMPDRQIGPAIRLLETDNTVVRVHRWGGTATADIPGMGQAGDVLGLDLCTLYVFRDDKIAEYHDYG
ncbi:MAG: hypothetical protein ACI9BW_001293 [Gammaproteobacteria bacterium]|jgi:hypothetical protein